MSRLTFIRFTRHGHAAFKVVSLIERYFSRCDIGTPKRLIDSLHSHKVSFLRRSRVTSFSMSGSFTGTKAFLPRPRSYRSHQIAGDFSPIVPPPRLSCISAHKSPENPALPPSPVAQDRPLRMALALDPSRRTRRMNLPSIGLSRRNERCEFVPSIIRCKSA